MKVGLVLGGGGSRGIAHIGVLQVLEREGISFDHIVGTSMGAIVGSLYALGIPTKVFTTQIRKMHQRGLINVTNWSARSRQQKLRALLQEALEGKTFDDLKIPACFMSVDMISGQEVCINQGPLMQAVLASSAVPTIFPTISYNGKQLADGGVIDSLATHVAYQAGVDRVIAVDIYPPLDPDNPWEDPVRAITGIQFPFLIRAAERVRTPTSLTSMWRAFRVMAWHIHEERLAAHPPHVLLRPAVSSIGSLDFKDFNGVLQAGIEEAERQLPEIKAALSDQD
jgi:NTE family protein